MARECIERIWQRMLEHKIQDMRIASPSTIPVMMSSMTSFVLPYGLHAFLGKVSSIGTFSGSPYTVHDELKTICTSRLDLTLYSGLVQEVLESRQLQKLQSQLSRRVWVVAARKRSMATSKAVHSFRRGGGGQPRQGQQPRRHSSCSNVEQYGTWTCSVSQECASVMKLPYRHQHAIVTRARLIDIV